MITTDHLDLADLDIDVDWMQEVLLELLRIPSPSGRTDVIMQHVGERLQEIGLPFELTRRGAMIGRLASEHEGLARAVIVHTDTIGCMVQALKPNGRLSVVPVGTHSSRFSEGTRVAIFTDDPERTFSGTILPNKASGHAFGDDIDSHPHGWEHVEVRVDEKVASAEDLAALGIQVGDFVAQTAYPVITRSGFVTSRHLDDKAGVAAALAAFKAVIDAGLELPVGAYLLITIAEEVGHGASSGLYQDVAEMVSVDSAVVAPGQHSTETGVTVAMQDLHGPFDYHLSRRLLDLGERHGLEMNRDVFRYYRSDVASALEAGVETRASLVGFGVDATHGHERTHLDSIVSTARLLALYLQTDLTFARWDAAPTGPLASFPSSAVQPVRREPEFDPEDDELLEADPFPDATRCEDRVMRIALMIEGQEGVTWAEWVALAQAAEDAGLDGLFRSDHYAGLSGDERRDATDAWACLSALAAVTDRLRLGTLVSPVTFRHPSELAKVVATVDHVAQGRVELGLGAGWNEREHEAYGFPFPPTSTRFELLEEQVEIVYRSWTEERFTFEGQHYTLRDVQALPHPVQSPPPIVIGGQAKARGAALAARYAAEYNTVYASPAQVRERRARLDAACEEVGRDPATLPLSLMTVAVVGTSDADVDRRIEAVLTTQGGAGGVDDFRRDHADHGLIGTVDEVRARLQTYRDAGVTRVMLQHLAHRDTDAVHLIGEHLIG